MRRTVLALVAASALAGLAALPAAAGPGQQEGKDRQAQGQRQERGGGKAAAQESAVVAAAGDISVNCGEPRCPDADTAELVEGWSPDAVVTMGDQRNDSASLEDFQKYFDPNWGRFKDLIKPSPGNHEYDGDPEATGYFDYFGEAARPQGKSWYSFDVGGWHMVSLNSEEDRKADGEQVRWLAEDLAATDKQCVMAYWHRPKYSSGSGHGDFPNMKPFWDVLQEHGADVVLNGHDHDYERFAPQDADGNATEKGIRQFVVGTGGAWQRPFGETRPNSEFRLADTFGALKLTLEPGSFAWQFVDTEGTVHDEGGPTACH
ncbi:metallophosphoesterase [Streptomyces sp. NPDC047108]|uniref:metallophosphoesterase family protein n=1 Tax=Streptomyces sp. NPDC047108 TaxID=3155025 RepID=UPI0033F5E0E0